MKKIVIAMIVAVSAFVAHADMTYSPFLLDGYDAGGSPIVDGTYVMLIDLDGDGFDFNNLDGTTGTWNFDADDYLMDVGQIVNGEAFPFDTITTAGIPSGYDANIDHYYVFWFDKAYSLADIQPGAGIHFGVEDLGAVGTDPGDYTPFLTGGNAQYQTVPEPASALLVAIGGGLVYALRRRGHRFVS